jgi:hypothetical protein
MTFDSRALAYNESHVIGLSGAYGQGTYGSGELGSMLSKMLKKNGFSFLVNSVQSVIDAQKSVWNHVKNEAQRVGNRVADNLEKAVRDVGSIDWYRDVARTVSRVYSLKLLTAIITYVYPPVALIATLIQSFLAKYKADFVATPEFLAIADKDDVNAFLGDVVVEMNKIDLFQTLPTLTLTELSIQAQDSKRKRDDLRMEVVQIQAKYASQKWAVVAKAVYQAAQTIVISAVTFGAGGVLIAGATVSISTLVQLGFTFISIATTLLQMQMMREVVRITKEQARKQAAEQAARDAAEMAALQAEIDRINAEIAALGGVPQPVVSADTSEVASSAPGGIPTGAKVVFGLAVGASLLYAWKG